jgi:hypothetical protein
MPRCHPPGNKPNPACAPDRLTRLRNRERGSVKSGQPMKGVDIHHIFPRKWCEDQKIPHRVLNSIVNKTAISFKANRMIGGEAPSIYLSKLQQNKKVQLDDAAMDAILQTHCIAPNLLRTDNFQTFFDSRRASLLAIVEFAMGKAASAYQEAAVENGSDVEDEEE